MTSSDLVICAIANFNNKAFKYNGIILSKFDKVYFFTLVFINTITLLAIFDSLNLTNTTVDYLSLHTPSHNWVYVFFIDLILNASSILEVIGSFFLIFRIIKLIEYNQLSYLVIFSFWITYIEYIIRIIHKYYLYFRQKVKNGIK